jgi:hypothetical protein
MVAAVVSSGAEADQGVKPIRDEGRALMSNRIAGVGMFMSALALTGCDGPTPSAPEALSAREVRGLVVGQAASSLTTNGQFALSTPEANAQLITPERARALAAAAVRSFAQNYRPWLERVRGGPIEFQSLQPASRVYFAESAYDQASIPAESHPAFRKHLGPFYLVGMHSGGTQILSIAVSAYNADVGIENGYIRFPVRHGDDFVIAAVNGIDRLPVPVSPEHAVQIAASALGVRVAAVPQLVLPSAHRAPQLARWRLVLERGVTLRGRMTGRTYVSREVFVGLRGDLSMAVPAQPASLSERDPSVNSPMPARRRLSMPVDFEPIAY